MNCDAPITPHTKILQLVFPNTKHHTCYATCTGQTLNPALDVLRRLWARVEVALSLPKAIETHQGTGVDLYMYNAGAELVSFIMTFLGLLVRSDFLIRALQKTFQSHTIRSARFWA
jgi:hypothetical protein